MEAWSGWPAKQRLRSDQEDVLDRAWDFGRQRQGFAAPLQALGGEHHAGARIAEPRGNGGGAEPGKNRHHRETQLAAAVQNGQDGRDHGQRQGHPVARFQAHGGEAVGHPVGVAPQLGESNLPGGAVFGLPDAGHARAAGRGGGPPVQAIVRDIDAAADEPLGPLGAVG